MKSLRGESFSAFLQKPFSSVALATKIREVLDADGFKLA